MLLQFSCSNYKSIKDKIDFSMRASSDATMLERTKEYNGAHILRMAAIYGANGSGKSNFISAMAFVRGLIVNSLHHQPGEPIPLRPHKLSPEDRPSSFDVQFVIAGVRYAYGFSILRGEISEEYLYHFPKQKQSRIFEREGMNFTFGRTYKNSFTLAMDALKENRLFLTCAANFSPVEEVVSAFRFFRQDIVVYRTLTDDSSMNNWMRRSIEMMNENPATKEKFVRILQSLGVWITGVETKMEEISLEDMKQNIPPELHVLFSSSEGRTSKFKSVEVRLRYEKFATDLMAEESTGIKKLFQIMYPLIDSISSGKILICDELEMGLHENIVSELIRFFSNAKGEKYSQLIFTTHDTNLLDLEVFRRDQIWFTELNEDRATDLYSLVEIRNVRKNENVSARYIEGKYGAIPMMNEKMIENLIESDVTA